VGYNSVSLIKCGCAVKFTHEEGFSKVSIGEWLLYARDLATWCDRLLIQ